MRVDITQRRVSVDHTSVEVDATGVLALTSSVFSVRLVTSCSDFCLGHRGLRSLTLDESFFCSEFLTYTHTQKGRNEWRILSLISQSIRGIPVN